MEGGQKGSAPTAAEISNLVNHYKKNLKLLQTMREQLLIAIDGSEELSKLIHSVKSRLKDPDHLREKLKRKGLECSEKSRPFPYTRKNLFYRVNDLVGVRILHLHTSQMGDIDSGLKAVFQRYRYKLVEGPTARTWDDENREFFRSIGLSTLKSPSMYTSVHYVVDGGLEDRCTAEIQVRTLAEELWGEVDHTINYPEKSKSLACREQIKALARTTSSCSRLVDSIFRSSIDHKTMMKRKNRKKS